MPTLFELSNLALETPAYRQEIVRAAFGDIMPECDNRLVSRLNDNDKMLQHCLNHFGNINFSLSHYLAVAAQQYRIVEKIKQKLFPNSPNPIKFLDFACGYGRLMRLMSLRTDPKTLWASDIQTDALDYVVASFGVNGVYSHADPEQFSFTEKFDFIWVASLFSHLPDHLFKAWLDRLSALLSPTGVLCFSVHDANLLPKTVALPDSGLYFNGQSEDACLDGSIYGTTYVSEAYVARQIGQLCGSTFDFKRIPKGLANEQDLYIAARSQTRDLSALNSIRHGTWGFVDKAFAEKDRLYLFGWAGSIDDGFVDHIEVRLNTDTHVCRANLPREDVVDVLKDKRLLRSGWEIHLSLAPAPATNFVAVTVVSTQNERALIYLGFVDNGRFSTLKN